jgi:hypothetical protein
VKIRAERRDGPSPDLFAQEQLVQPPEVRRRSSNKLRTTLRRSTAGWAGTDNNVGTRCHADIIVGGPVFADRSVGVPNAGSGPVSLTPFEALC